ncbi:MAG: tetratricopeptide repeat protein [Planctomycetaceae bacterium]|nr:tetratricopeptide repeat protein [Planctomycetaceae bacterium]
MEHNTLRDGLLFPEAASISIVGICLVVLTTGCGRFINSDSNQGVALYEQGNYLGAANSFQRALEKQPGNADCFYNLGATYHQQSKLFGQAGDLQTAEQYYHLCLARDPDHAACQRGLAVLLVETGRTGDAATQLEQWAARQPANPEPRIELARLCHEQGDDLDAENYLIDAVSIDPENPRALVALGQIRESSGDTQQALANYSKALELDRNQPTVAAKVATLSSAGPSSVIAIAPPVGGSSYSPQ